MYILICDKISLEYNQFGVNFECLLIMFATGFFYEEKNIFNILYFHDALT